MSDTRGSQHTPIIMCSIILIVIFKIAAICEPTDT